MIDFDAEKFMPKFRQEISLKCMYFVVERVVLWQQGHFREGIMKVLPVFLIAYACFIQYDAIYFKVVCFKGLPAVRNSRHINGSA